jgi:hypothetical protein
MAMVLVIISCMMVLIKFWDENEILEEKEKKIAPQQIEKQVPKTKKK